MEKGYSIVETAKLLGLQVRTAREWARVGKIKAKKIAGSKRWIVMEGEILRLQGEEHHENKD